VYALKLARSRLSLLHVAETAKLTKREIKEQKPINAGPETFMNIKHKTDWTKYNQTDEWFKRLTIKVLLLKN